MIFSAGVEIRFTNVACKFSTPLRWQEETKRMCCFEKVRLDLIQQPPELLKSLLRDEHNKALHFLDNNNKFYAQV